MCWPTVKRAGDTGLPGGSLMPFTKGARAVTIEAHHFGYRRNPVRNFSGVTRKSGRRLHDRAGIGLMMVSTGLQRVPRGGAQCGRVEIIVTQPIFGQPVHRRRINGSTKWGSCTEAHVIDQHNDNVRCTLRRLDAEQWRCLDIANIQLFELGGIRFCNREVRTIYFKGLCTYTRPKMKTIALNTWPPANSSSCSHSSYYQQKTRCSSFERTWNCPMAAAHLYN